MAPTKNKLRSREPRNSGMDLLFKKYFSQIFVKKLIFDPNYLSPVCWLLLIFETFLNIIIIEKVKYTEIDWIAYMQEVEGFLNGTLDYKELRGDTGPLVYPAGFVYIFSILYYITSQGKNIYFAQYIFLVFYLLQTFLIQRIFRKTLKLPPYALVLTTLTSYRIHSIFVLRLFNDPIAVLLFYVSLNLFLSNKWLLGSVFYSLAVSVKMNILLYSPSLLMAYLTNLSYSDTFYNLLVCALIQLILGTPFLYGNIFSYIKGSFDFGRIFEHKWTVNFRFIPQNIFEDRFFHLLLLVLHISLLIIFTPHFKRYLSSYAKLNVVTAHLKSQIKIEKKKQKLESEKMTKNQKQFLDSFEKQLKSGSGSEAENVYDENSKIENNMSKISQLFVLPFFISNFIGVACARSLHYQFYSWYFHSLLYLVFCTGFSKPCSFLLLGLIEYCWNVYPSTNFSSILLHICHFIILFGLYRNIRK
ncbi:ALG3, alpha-1,3- mannosyltransferase [Leptinotarsa decemlineata]|uniref:ALG3, alpha-1,3- mannosyltransferase n=1 Tax=Leptinotarsa decemlineata TaxID=7539 RepID=UPI003D30C5F7